MQTPSMLCLKRLGLIDLVSFDAPFYGVITGMFTLTSFNVFQHFFVITDLHAIFNSVLPV